ncbi:helix-hairpin-helix domain-containing protein [Kineosporia sp. NBRC 101677]|uniref:helix-hairpin-helix domain-containing protein n=1 Tax=Kineosporia sp. NBRC 101677 TaxID=3032197 RepID=UPI0025547DC6|nr:helix-hairpin-helix domain-containing protein [Kineosporia sp. NBRC 101677]
MDEERALRELRESLIRGRVPGGARWEVPLRAAIAVAVAALMVVAVVVVFLLRSDGGSEGALIDESAPLVSTSAAQPVPSSAPDVTAVADSTPSPGPLRVHVVGQVREPGVVALGSDARVQDAIEAAGGATGRADLARINLARKVIDGERILVPKPGQKLPAESSDGGSVEASAGSGGNAGSGSAAPIDLNTASVTELDALPGVGPVLAARIVEWRQANGRFATVDDLNEVSGIGDATMEKLRPLVRV